MRTRIPHLVMLALVAYAFLAEARPLVRQAFSPVIGIGELGAGVKIYLVARNDKEEANEQVAGFAR